MDAKRLYFHDGTPADVWTCGKCGALRDIGIAPIGLGDGKTLSHAERLPFVEESAQMCCDYKCSTCGVKTRQFFTKCDDCRRIEWDKEAEEKEAADFLKAKERTDYEGPFMFGDKFYQEVGCVIEYCQDNDIPIPAYLWVPEEIKFEMDAGHIIENALEEHAEDSDDNITSGEAKELQALLDAWCERMCIRSYGECHKEYVRVPK